MTHAERVRDSDLETSEVMDLFMRRPETRDLLVEHFLPLARVLALRFRGRGEPVDDLIQVASLGLVKSVDRFDTERGVRFSTYATATIIGEIKRHFRDTSWSIRLPRQLQENTITINRVFSELSQTLGRSPTVAEVAQEARLSPEDVLDAMEAAHAASTTSLVDHDDGSATDIAMPDDAFEILEGWHSVAGLIRELPLRERQILYLRFVESQSQSQIAERIGISQMHVSRLLARTLANLREAAVPTGQR